jgi:hypothetical protein
VYKVIIKFQAEYYKLTETGEFGQQVDENRVVVSLSPDTLEELKKDVEYHFLEPLRKFGKNEKLLSKYVKNPH